MKYYEVTFIVDPVLSGDEIKSTAKTYTDMLSNEGCNIIHVEQMGLKQLAYSINKRSSGIYYCIEFSSEGGGIIPKLELSMRRDERIMRFLTILLDKYGVKYNEDKRNGVIRKYEPKTKKKELPDKKFVRGGAPYEKPAFVPTATPAPVPVVAAPIPVAAAPIVSLPNEEE